MVKFFLVILCYSILILTGISDIAFSQNESLIIGNDSVVLDFSRKTWGKDALFTISGYKDEKTPDGNVPVKIEVSKDNNGPSFPVDKLKNVKNDWTELSFWIKPDDSDATVKFEFGIQSNNEKQKVHVFIFKLIGKDWKKLVFNNSTWSNDSNRFSFEKVTSMRIVAGNTFGKKSEFLIGPLTFGLKSSGIALSELNVLDVPRTSSAPALDGQLNDVCWKNAASITKYIPLKKEIAEDQPFDTRICYDDKFIYVGVSQKLDTSKLFKLQKVPQMGVYQDDSLNFFLSPLNDGRTSYQFIVNSISVKQGARYYFDQIADAFIRQSPWEGKWEAESFIGKELWSTELKIPYTDFTPSVKPGDIIGMQTAFLNPSLSNGAWSWALTGNNLCVPENFGAINMVNAIGKKIAVEKVDLEFDGNIPVVGIKINHANSCNVTVSLANPEGNVFTVSSEINGSGILRIKDYQTFSGVQRLTVIAEAAGYMRTVRCFKSTPVFFANKTSLDKNILCPEPKEYSENSSVWKPSGSDCIFIPADADEKIMYSAEKLKENMAGYMQTELNIKQDNSIASGCIVVGKDPAKLAQKASLPEYSKLSDNGAYLLEINADGILLRGKDAEGLFYGVLTLAQLERYAFMRNEESLRGAVIRDWPSCQFRIYKNAIDGVNIQNCKLSHDEMLNYFYKILDRYVIDVKMNSFSLLSVNSIKYERELNKKINIFPRAAFLSIPKLKKLNSYCSSNFVKFIPAMSGPSHCLWMTLPYPALAMPDYLNWDANPAHEEFFKIYFSVMDEIIDAVKPERFIIMQDEWWHRPKGNVSSTFNGKEKREIFRETIEKIHGHLNDRNIKSIMFSDMLQRVHNGGIPYNNYLNAPLLPKDITMLHWSNCKSAAMEFTQLGYQENWFLTNRFRPHNLSAEDVKKMKVNGFGVIAYASMAPDTSYGYASNLRSADYAWNLGNSSETGLDDWIIQRGRNVIANSSILKNPHAGRKFIVLELKNAFNNSWTGLQDIAADKALESFSGGEFTAGFIPMKAGEKTDKLNCIAPEINKVVSVPVNRNASSLIFLHTQILPRDKIKDFVTSKNRFDCWDGVRIGAYKINYEDSSSELSYIRSSENCGNILPYKGIWGASVVENTYPVDCRFVMELSGNEKPCLYQYEWVNPHPEKKISDIEIISYGMEAKPVLFAITLRDLKCKSRN